MTDKDIEAIRDLKDLKLIFDASVGHREDIAQSTKESITRTCQNRILRQLWFRKIDDRKEFISLAHSKTLDWALEPPTGEFVWDDLSLWLQQGSGIYWISGKAGSGKSTLIKHLFHHAKAPVLLSQWAGGKQYSFVHFFFWNLGTYEQKSQEGLSRALLYQILSGNPSLIADVLPNMWKQIYEAETDASLPSIAETKYAFQVIASKALDIGKFCFFIDGLDEFVGNHLDGITFLKELTANEHIKIILSSRPIPDCVVSFEHLPSLRLHQLNHADITSYVQDFIGGHNYMHELIAQHPEEAKRVLEDVVTKSSGVFLWVILACRSLVSGFSDYDRISELRRRVNELPPELEEMFQHMLIKINKRHREQGAQVLRLCHTAHQAPENSKFSAISSLGLALLDANSVNSYQIPTLTNHQKRRLCNEIDGRLRSRCGGLLELQTKNITFLPSTIFCFCGAQRVTRCTILRSTSPWFSCTAPFLNS